MARIALVHDVAGVAAVQAELLRDAGHEVEQIGLPTFGASWTWPAKALALPVRAVAFLPVVWRLRRGRYDIVHIHFLSQGIVGVLAGRPFFAQAHGSDLHVNLRHRVYRRITDVVMRRATAIFYVTPNLPAYMDGYQSKLVYLPNPVVSEGQETGQETRAPAPASVSRILIFTRLHSVKGVDRIFPAAERLRTIASVTALEFGPLAPEYVARYKRWVDFVKPVPHAEVSSFIRRFDIVIGQMRQGVLGLMEIETLAAGRPLVAAVDLALYADDPPPVVNASSPDEIVAAVERVRGDSQELARVSAQGRAWAARNHGGARHLALLEAAYFGK